MTGANTFTLNGTTGDAGSSTPNTGSWSVSLVPGFELGAGFLLPDGRVFLIGATTGTALYTPPTPANPAGTWVAGPTIPMGLGANDRAGSGPSERSRPLRRQQHSGIRRGWNVAVRIRPGQQHDQPGHERAQRPEFQPLGRGGIRHAHARAAERTGHDHRLDRPVVPYQSAGSPQNSWRPTIDNIKENSDGSFTLTGTQINGLSEGAAYGDDAQMATNYPIVRITDMAGQTLYATTSDWSTDGVQTGSTPETVQFTLPTGVTLAQVTSFTVIANGIASAPASPVILNNTDENVTIQVNPLDSTQVQVLVTNTNTVVATYPNNSPNPIAVFGDSNNNILTVNEGNGVVNTPISFDGGGSPGAPGDQMIVLGTSGDDTLDLTPATPTSATMTFDGSPVYSFTNINQFAFDGEAGNDTLIVDSSKSLLGISGGVHFDGGTGNNDLQLLQTGGPSETSDTYTVNSTPGQGSDVIVGGAATQQVFFQNLAPVYDNVPGPLSVLGTASNNIINYEQGPNSGNAAAPYNGDTTGLVTIDNFKALEFLAQDALNLSAATAMTRSRSTT